jgi:hypothetical protein
MESKSEPQYCVNSTNFEGHYSDNRNYVPNQDIIYDSHPMEPYDRTGRDGGRDYSVLIEHGGMNHMESRRNDSSTLCHAGSNYNDVAYALGSTEEAIMLRNKFEHSQLRNDAEANSHRHGDNRNIEGDGRAFSRRPDIPFNDERRRALEVIHVDGSYHPSVTNRAQRERKVRSSSMLPSLSPVSQSNPDPFQRASLHQPASQHPLSFYLNHSGDPAAAFSIPDFASKGNLTMGMGRSFSGFSTPHSLSSRPQSIQQPTVYNSLPVLCNTYDYNLEDVQINEQKEKLLAQRQRRQQLFLEMQKETQEIERENLAMARTLKGRIEIFTPETAPQSPMTGSSAPDSNRSGADTSVSGHLSQTDLYDNDDSDFMTKRKEQTLPSTVIDLIPSSVEKQEVTLATLDLAHKQEMKEIEHEIERLKLMRADTKREEERTMEVARADARRLEKMKERREEEEKERREEEEKKRREDEDKKRKENQEKDRREEESRKRKEDMMRKEEVERREYEVKNKERKEEVERSERLKAAEDRMQAERIDELKQKIEKQRRQYEAKKREEEAAKMVAKDAYRTQLLRSDSHRSRIEVRGP